jgi:agmatine deiminase
MGFPSKQEEGDLRETDRVTTTRQTPFLLGYRMPAEWERHEATWLSWPKDPLTFPPDVIGRVEQIYVEMVHALAEGERVELLVDDLAMEGRVRRLLGEEVAGKKGVRFHRVKTADVWTRDYAPIFVRGEKGVAAVKWRFNAWGNKYDELKADDEAGMRIAECAGLPLFEPGIVLEGGSIDVNGRGTCLTTKQCLLNRNRNPHLNRAEIETYLRDYLGTTNVVWLNRGIAGDDTDGHIDDIARFVDDTTVICMVEEDPKDENHDPLEQNLELLRVARNERGETLSVVPMRMPGSLERDGRLPASYANFYIGNSAVLVPVFAHDENDIEALRKLRELFPGRKVVGIDCRALVYGFGGIHCVTQQQPSPRDGERPQ